MTMIAGRIKIFVVAFVAVYRCTNAWMPPIAAGTRNREIQIRPSEVLVKRPTATLHAAKAKTTTANNEGDPDKNITEDVAEGAPKVEWGVSYIGGDPCGSKYNSDPFDKNPSDKPGLPDDMKARIAALAEKKLREEQDKKK
mmetsp:Transcript_26866/g.63123  ORF Transcript_26866/g.63123 Transcript_26866/m.63123 type:complete len:141 (+) Transcript_26866:60-482(+)|eukprot:CAMPEP_0197174706 /NCGR_PEP_ID=MMETSP1423-20130617/1103_1 /TAXON_ID=476441 /ORGANISM="Pseudo-nitzschia heimii, Strain UNC1101" /LENGTH=140 /DNA_ID=CAMNT_0042623651 /DNA_START=9 /DNA_END=431 /DNA_ORIENTATION=-